MLTVTARIDDRRNRCGGPRVASLAMVLADVQIQGAACSRGGRGLASGSGAVPADLGRNYYYN